METQKQNWAPPSPKSGAPHLKRSSQGVRVTEHDSLPDQEMGQGWPRPCTAPGPPLHGDGITHHCDSPSHMLTEARWPPAPLKTPAPRLPPPSHAAAGSGLANKVPQEWLLADSLYRKGTILCVPTLTLMPSLFLHHPQRVTFLRGFSCMRIQSRELPGIVGLGDSFK